MTIDAPVILLAEDDAADVLIMRTAAKRAALESTLVTVKDGVELIDYLRDPSSRGGRPYLVLLDLNMPRMDGREALDAIRSNPDTKALPVVVLSTTDRAEEAGDCLARGANSFVAKPRQVAELVRVLSVLEEYWLRTAWRAAD